MSKEPFESVGEVVQPPPKRNAWQTQGNKHEDTDELNRDWDTINLICDLYDMGIDLKMLRRVYKDIDKERSSDYASDVSEYESHVRSGLSGGPLTSYE